MAVMLWKVFLPVFLLVGIPGNIMSLVVLSRKRMRGSTTSVYLRVLAVIDTVVLLIAVPRKIMYFYAFIDVTKISSFTCKFYTFLHPSTIAISWCLLPVITVDRFIHVRYPIWAKEHCSKRSAVVIFIVLSAAVLAINCHRLIFNDIQEMGITKNSTKVKYTCAASKEWYAQFKNESWTLIYAISFSVAPVICQLLGNVMLVRELVLRSKQKKTRKPLKADHRKDKQDLKVITRMLLTVYLVFVLSSIPQCTQMVIKRHIFDTDNPRDVARSQLFQCIVQILLFSNNSINFLLYAVSGRVFRHELRTLFQHVRYPVLKWLGRRVHPIEATSGWELQAGTSKARSTGECSLETKTTAVGRY